MTSHGPVIDIEDRGLGDWHTYIGSFSCDNCQHISVAWHSSEEKSSFPSFDAEERLEWMIQYAEWLPKVGIPKDFSDVPEHIAKAASEAHECLSIKAYRAAVMLARSVVEATAKEKGITTGKLVSKIDALHQQGMIRTHVKEAAHEIRYLGNDMAHGDFVNPVSSEEAEETLGLMGEVLHEVFQSPAKIDRLRTARMQKKQAGNQSSNP